MEFHIYHVVDSCTSQVIVANNLDEVIDSLEYDPPTVCYNCSSRVNLGDIIGTVISNDEGDELYNNLPYNELSNKNEQLVSIIKELEEKIKELEK